MLRLPKKCYNYIYTPCMAYGVNEFNSIEMEECDKKKQNGKIDIESMDEITK